MKNVLFAAALLAGAALAHADTSPAKKELVAKILKAQQPGLEVMARQIAQAPVLQLLQDARNVLMTQVPADKREAIAKSIETDARQFVDEITPLIRDRAVALAPSTMGAVLEDKLSEDELKQILAWLESPASRKYQGLVPEMQTSLGQKLMGELSPVLDPKLKALQQRMQASFGGPPPAASAASRPAPARAASAARPASR
jgi:hypothetical protein